GNGCVTFQMQQRRYFQFLTSSIFRKEQSYEFEKNHSPWLRSRICFRSLDCDGADERARWFYGRDGNGRRFHATFDGRDANARWFYATFDGRDANERWFHAPFNGTDANAWRSDDEFTLRLPTFWRSKLQRS